jgi:hypothetical protein
MSSHTPGPWILDENERGWGLLSNGSDVTSEPFDCSTDDARLIAAAPELLEALQSFIDLSDDGSLHIEGSIATEDPVITAARAAIAKAEGRGE